MTPPTGGNRKADCLFGANTYRRRLPFKGSGLLAGCHTFAGAPFRLAASPACCETTHDAVILDLRIRLWL